MSIEKTLIHAQRIVDVLPQCRRDDMQNLIKLLDEQQKQITSQSNTILEQREQLQLVRNRNTELTQALESIGYMPPLHERTSRQRVTTMMAAINEAF